MNSFDEYALDVRLGLASPLGFVLLRRAFVPIICPPVPKLRDGDACSARSDTWAYAQFTYDPAAKTCAPSALSATGRECGFACHTITKTTDYILTKYPLH
jgi:hypothetical protein